VIGVGVKKVMIVPDHSPLLGIADESLAQSLAREVELFATAGRVAIVSTLMEVRLHASRAAPQVIFLDSDLLQGSPPAQALDYFRTIAPVILLAPLIRQLEIAPFVAAGDVDFVARAGDFVPLAASLIERRLRWAEKSKSVPGPPWPELPADLASIFRHEINNPLTGILGNAELLLAHRDRLAAVDTHRLQTVVDLAVRLRETIRRLSDAWENRPPSTKSA
jgi:signal transduction histidine kinase